MHSLALKNKLLITKLYKLYKSQKTQENKQKNLIPCIVKQLSPAIFIFFLYFCIISVI